MSNSTSGGAFDVQQVYTGREVRGVVVSSGLNLRPCRFSSRLQGLARGFGIIHDGSNRTSHCYRGQPLPEFNAIPADPRCIQLSAFHTRKSTDNNLFVRTHVAAFFVSLLFCDILQGKLVPRHNGV